MKIPVTSVDLTTVNWGEGDVAPVIMTEGSDCWFFTANHYGEAKVTVHFRKLDGEMEGHEFYIHVTGATSPLRLSDLLKLPGSSRYHHGYSLRLLHSTQGYCPARSYLLGTSMRHESAADNLQLDFVTRYQPVPYLDNNYHFCVLSVALASNQ